MKWYYAEGGKQIGPVEESALDDLVRQGVVRDETLVWREGMAAWQRHAAVRGSTNASSSPSPAAPPPPSPAPALTLDPQPSYTQPSYSQPTYPQAAQETGGARHYGGFWIRFLARLIDWFLMGVAMCVVFIPLAIVSGGFGTLFRDFSYRNGQIPDGLPAIGFMWLLGIICLALVIPALYEIYFVSTRSATPGKLALGLKIIRAEGGPMTAGLATGRFFAHILTSLIPLEIGYIIAAFDSQKRAIHDYICGTRVVYTR